MQTHIYGTRLPAGCGYSTVLPEMDFESYSEAGCIWNGTAWVPPAGATKKGIAAVGAVAYSEHPSTEVLSLAYDLKDGLGPRLWIPGMLPPQELFNHFSSGQILEAWNCIFEYWIWVNVCVPQMGWPAINHWQLRDAMAKSRAFALPGALGNAAEVSGAAVQKIADGTRLINLFCVPRKPTAKNPAFRVRPEEQIDDAQKLYDYCLGDIKAEAAVSALCPDLTPTELEVWLCTQQSNVRGMALDMTTIRAGVKILDQALTKYNTELASLTGGVVERASEVSKLLGWIGGRGVRSASLDADAIDTLLERPTLPAEVRRALEIRQLVGSASVKKLYAMDRMASKAGRAHDLIVYHAARTGRDGGKDIQAQNLAKAGPKLYWCSCGKPYGTHARYCPHCGAPCADTKKSWSWEAVDHAVEVIRTGQLEEVERVFGDALLTLSGCIRGLFIAGPGKDLLCSDYASIEAVVTACLAGEQWRIDAFHRKEDIYLVSCGRITGTPLDAYVEHKKSTGSHHPDRQKIGKPAELGLGFGGWVNAWRQFDSSDAFTDEQVKQNIIAWREASPAIVELWGGQVRGRPWAPERKECYGLEGMAISAVINPGSCYEYRGITFGMKGDVLYCRLPSCRLLTYHRPRLSPSTRWDDQLELSFEGWNSNPKMGPFGWIRMRTYGGRLTENVVQATARDIMVHSVPKLERAGYPVVLRIHDEIVTEVPEGVGSIDELETIMGTPPKWASNWPVRAAGGWRGKRYRKD